MLQIMLKFPPSSSPRRRQLLRDLLMVLRVGRGQAVEYGRGKRHRGQCREAHLEGAGIDGHHCGEGVRRGGRLRGGGGLLLLLSHLLL